MVERADVIVVGGGLAGLACALELKANGREVLVLEQAPHLGGKAGTANTPLGDFPTGPTSFNGRHGVFWKFLRLLGLEDSAVPLSPSSKARFIVRQGRLEAIHPNPLSVLSTGALTLSDKISLAKDLLSSSRSTETAEDESLDAFLERRFGRALVDHFFAAVLTGIFAGDLKKLSAASCMPALVNAEKEYGSVLRGALKALRKSEDGARPGLFAFKGGFGLLGRAATKAVAARTGVTVTSLEVCAREVRITANTASGELAFEASHVVVATEAFAAASLLQKSAPRAADRLMRFPYAPLALVQWAEKTPGQSRLPLGFGYLSAPIENRFAMGALFVGDLLGEAPRRFSTFVGGGVEPHKAALSDDEIAHGCADDLKALSGGSFGEIANVQRWPKAVFQPPPGHAKQLELLRAELQGLPLSLAGSYFGGAAMKDALASGFEAAFSLLNPPAVAVLQRRTAEVRA